LMALKSDVAEFAFLSACSTSATADLSLLDESVNLSVAMHLLGYPSVVGTFWSVLDSTSWEVTKRFYARMFSSSEGKFDTRKVGEALHHVIREERKSVREAGNERGAIIWGAYMHVGL